MNFIKIPSGRWFYMKKDSDLPWVTRIFRWAVLALFVAYGLLLVIEKAKEVLT